MRISTTTLETFRLYCQPDQEWMTEDQLVASIRGEFVPDHKVQLGTAFGAVLEQPDRFKVANGYRYQGFFFDDYTMDPALALFDRRGVFEAKATKAYGLCTVVARADQLIGARIIENKTTLSTFDFDKYAASAQWRFMLDIFEAAQVTYHVFCLSESTSGEISLRSTETFNLFPYPALHRDCCALLERFVEYVTRKGLDALLRQRQAEAA